MTDINLNRTQIWINTLQSSNIAHDVDGAALASTLENDLTQLHQDIGFIFDDSYGSEARTDLTVHILRKWQITGETPSLPALCLFALQNLTQPDHDYIPVLIAAILGEIPNNLPYHGNVHYKKVILQLIRLIVAHNKIYAETPRVLNDDQIALLLIGACVHDLNHDGLGNTVKGVFTSGRTERHSFDSAKNSLKMAGLDETALAHLKVMLLCTDVSPIGAPTSPVRQMKAAFCFHFRPELMQTDALNLSDELIELETNQSLAELAVLLHEADIATSAGLNYQVTQYETVLYREELKQNDARPSHVVEFLDKTCQRKFFSDAGKRLYSANIARIYALAQHDMDHGNEAFPAAHKTEFMQPFDSDDMSSCVIH